MTPYLLAQITSWDHAPTIDDELSAGTKRRVKQRWYRCDRCGMYYPETKVFIFNGLITCSGPGTTGCQDKSGHAAAMRMLVIPLEERPQPLPAVTEDL